MFKQSGGAIVFVLLVALMAGCGASDSGRASPPSAAEVAGAPIEAPVLETPVPTAAEPASIPSAAGPSAAGGDTWNRTYGGNRDSVVGGILPADDGGYFIVGTTNLAFEPRRQGDVYLIRTDAAGQVLWERTLGGEGYDGGQALIRAEEGTLLIAGVTTSFGAEGIDAYLLAVDEEGNELWSKVYGGPLDEWVGAIGQAADGGYVLGGNIVDPDDVIADAGAAGYGGFEGRSNPYLLKVDAEGNETWSRRYESADNVLASGCVHTADGGLLVLATITYFPEPDDDILLMKLDGAGNEVWSRTWTEGASNPYGLIRASDGNYLITASYAPLGGEEEAKEDFLFLKVDAQGNEIWRSTFGDPDTIDYGVVLAEAADGGYVAVGERTRDHHTWDTDITIAKVDQDGQFLWEQSRTASHTMLSAILPRPDGGYVIAGSTYRDPVFKILLMKTDSAGHMAAW